MKRITCLTLIVFLLIGLCSCTDDADVFSNFKEDNHSKVDLPITDYSSIPQNQQIFAISLSKALYNDKDVRDFVQRKSLEQYDIDNNVLYYRVKNDLVKENLSLRDVLLKYVDDVDAFIEAENLSALLSFFIPNLTFYIDFNAELWDTSNDQIAVIYLLDKNKSIIENGEIIGNVDPGFIPAFPAVVVKDNPYVKVKERIATRASGTVDYDFDFIDEDYKGQNTLGTRSSSNTLKVNLRDHYEDFQLDDYIAKEYFDQRVIDAYKIREEVREGALKGRLDPEYLNFAQRDHIYYKLGKNKREGTFDQFVTETLFRFKIDPSLYKEISSDKRTNNSEDGDPYLEEINKYKQSWGYSYEEVVEKIWAGGNYKFRLTINLLQDGGSVAPFNLSLTVKPDQLFGIEKYRYDYRSKKAFKSRRHKYYVENPEKDLVSLWYYPKNTYGVYTPPTRNSKGKLNSLAIASWDLSRFSVDMNFFVYEYDPTGKRTTEDYFSTQFTKKFNIEGNVGITGGVKNEGSVNGALKIGYGTDKTTTTSKKLIYEYQTSSQDLGKTNINYIGNIIREVKGDKVLPQKVVSSKLCQQIFSQ